ncbi:hypothetical protein [Colwellia psychrerythraea]|uniref:Uncharacterized protein n=1 Tax=Colwellia psychrerythraea TaxID=28229 RepID=A0A099L4B0_COLPS|nr:hypothetical protein GAB14E_1455 [Colwellia psychrerythraea]
MINFVGEEISYGTNKVILALRSYQTNVQLAESAKKMLNKTLQLGQR